jgi:metal-responsive CopG/Arc/MetJ family transcriptional regulator
MNFSIHMDSPTLGLLDATAKAEGKSRSALLREAFHHYLDDRAQRQANAGWSQVLVDHWATAKASDFADIPDFDDTSDLLPLRDPDV